MLVPHTVCRGNMTILAINMTMYDVDFKEIKTRVTWIQNQENGLNQTLAIESGME